MNTKEELSIKLQELTAKSDMTDVQFIKMLEFVESHIAQRESALLSRVREEVIGERIKVLKSLRRQYKKEEGWLRVADCIYYIDERVKTQRTKLDQLKEAL